ncbi:MAG TPA: hypothetical protein VHY22_08475 [Chthoniobacteraceae bacterium]|jgi:hypothetical protein|nr:hypothetical protein [Chthoniobacteraceae bacterium]
MKNLCLAIFCILNVLLYNGKAQAPASSASPDGPPALPLLAPKLPSWCQWTVDYRYKTSNPLDAPRPQQKVVVQTGSIRHEVEKFERGSQEESWATGQAVVVKKSDSPRLVTIFKDSTPGAEFPEFNWIALSNFKGRMKIDGVNCLIFRQMITPLRIGHPELFGSAPSSPNDDGAFGTSRIEVTAMIVESSRLPLELQMPTETRRYTFLQPPVQMLEPPAEFLAAAKEGQARIESTTHPLSPP